MRKSAPKSVDAMYTHKEQGKVPKYLLKQKEMKEQEANQRQIDAENAKCPPGTRLMPEDERLDTLAQLRLSKKDTED